MTDIQRDAIDTESKSTFQDLAGSIRQLNDVEKIRRDTERQIAAKKYGRGNGIGNALGRWAAGGIGSGQTAIKSEEEKLDEERRGAFDGHRESVIWFLRQRLGQAAETQREMMERRVQREVEKSKSVLWKVKDSVGLPLETNEETAAGNLGPSNKTTPVNGGIDPSTQGVRIPGLTENEVANIESRLSPEQLQLFAQENNDMLKRYEDTLDQIRYVSRIMLILDN